MLTVKIMTDRKQEFILEALKYHIAHIYVNTYKEWKERVEKQEGAIQIISEPDKDCTSIGFKEIKIQDNEGWSTYYVYNADIYVMNEAGQTISTHRK